MFTYISIPRDVAERNSWLDALNSAIEEYRSRKATFVTLDHLNPILRFEGKVGDAAPVWIPDQRVTMCQSCSTEFSLVSRRHHCRGCGKVVCAQCSASKAPLRYRQFEPSRVCDTCYDAVERSENTAEFSCYFTKHFPFQYMAKTSI